MGGSAKGCFIQFTRKKMCPSTIWHRARFARTLQTHHCGGDAMKAVYITHQPAQGVLLESLVILLRGSELVLHFILENQCFVLV